MAYDVICCDPPWQFKDKLPGKTRGAEKNYKGQSMTVPQIVALRPDMAANAVLFLWRVAAMQVEAFEVMKAWGFTLKTELVWIKVGVPHKDPPKTKFHWDRTVLVGSTHQSLGFTMGRSVRGAHETCLIAVRGRMPVANRSVRSVFFGSLREHSRKPEEFYDIVETLYPARNYLEMYARTTREGWDAMGDETDRFVPVKKW